MMFPRPPWAAAGRIDAITPPHVRWAPSPPAGEGWGGGSEFGALLVPQ
jgi:hypothetical protein